MSITIETLVTRVRNELEDDPWVDYLSSSYAAASGSVSVAQPTMWAEGDRMEVDDGSGNILRVKTTPSSNPITIKAGFHNTTDANASSGAAVLKNPEFEHDEVLNAIKRVIDGLRPYIYVVRTSTINFAAGVKIYAVPSDYRKFINLTQDVTPTAAPTKFAVVRYGVDKGYPVAEVRDVPTTVAASGVGLYLPVVVTTPTTTATLTYASDIASAPSSGNFVDITDGPLADLVCMGACERLLRATESHRDMDDVAQGDVGAPAGTRLRTASYYGAEFRQQRRDYELYQRSQEPVAGLWSR